MEKFSSWKVGNKLCLMMFTLVGIVFVTYGFSFGYSSSKLMEKQAIAQVQDQARMITELIDLFDNSTRSEVNRFSKIFGNYFTGEFSLDSSRTTAIGGRNVPVLKNGGSDINLNFSVPDRFTAQTGEVATVFVKDGEDYMRISTSLKRENGERAVGTLLDRNHPSYSRLQSGEKYTGLANLFGKQYMTEYTPIKNGVGKVIGVLFVGVNITEDLATLKNKLKTFKLGVSGYFFVLDAAPGGNYGKLVMHPTAEGKNALEEKDASGRAYVKDILEGKENILQLALSENGKATRNALNIVTQFKDWNWTIVGHVYNDEITHEVRWQRNLFAVIGGAVLVGIAVLLYLSTRKMITSPLNSMVAASNQLAAGDLTIRLETSRNDDVGQLMKAIDSIGTGLTQVVNDVRHASSAIATASAQIASGNQDLSSRTEQQASSLEETASSMEELTSTVRQNAENAQQANQLAVAAADVAAKGGTVVSQVVDTMNAIDESSKKIVDIINVIDGIAFQTNILALNAAVEAARAGEQGRGFAVVASEVRSLAQRSASAAHEIKTLIDDSVEKVEAGSKLVADAGATMNEIVESIHKVSDVMGEITAASAEQSQGIEQVNQAITQMDTVTQQNAALVEEAAAAAESLQDQAKHLVKTVSVFKTDGSQALASSPMSNVVPMPSKQKPASQLAYAAPKKQAVNAKQVSDDWEEY